MTEQEEFEFRARLEAEAAAAANDQRPVSQRIAEDVGDDAVNPLFASGAGGIGAMVLGPSVEAGYQAATGRPGPTPDAAARLAEPGSPGQRWAAKTGYGSGPGESVRDVREHYVKENAPIGQGKISKKMSRATPGTVQAAVEREQQQALEARIRAKNRPMSEKIASRTPGVVQDVGRGVGAGIEKFPRWASRGVAGANLGYQGADAYNRALAGDVPGAAVSGTGALGSALFMLPGKYKKAIGAGMSIGSHLLNRGMDEARENPEGYAKGRSVELIGRGVEGGLDLAKRMFTPKPTKAVKASEALGPHENKLLGLTQTDNFGVHGGRMGGNQFPNFQNISPLHARDRVVWMNDSEKHANDMVNRSRIGDRDTIWSTYIGAPDQLKSNKTVANDILQNFYGREWTPEQLDLINQRIATYKKGKDKPLVFSQPFDIRDKFAAQELGMDTFERRGALASILGAGEGAGGKRAGLGLPNYEDILKSHRDPLTEGVPTSSVGTRLFSVDPTPSRFSKEYHPDYNWAVHGQDMGVQFNPVPQNVIVPDWYTRTEAKSPGKNRTHGNAWFSYMKDPQLITHDYLMGLEKAGYAKGGLAHLAAGGEAFKNLVKAYKLFRTKPDDPETLYPLFVNANKPVPVGEWLQAEVGPVASSGKVKSKLGELAYRPGWHAGDLPLATHIGAKSDPKLRAPDLRPPNQVWAEVDMPADVDWQSIANQKAQRNKSGLIIPRTAHITDEIPFGGHYRYKTSPNMEGNWLISGDMRVNRVLSDEEVRAINEASGMYDLPRYSPLKRANGGLANVEEIEEPELK